MAIISQSGKYFVRLSVGGGKKKWIPGGFETRAEAEAHEARLKAGLAVETWDEFSERWLTEYPAAKESTQNTYRHAARYFSRDFKGLMIGTALEESTWAKERGLRGNDRQVARAWALENRHRIDVVRTMVNAAVNEGIVDRNPFTQLRVPKSKGRRNIEPLTVEEVYALADATSVLRPEVQPVMRGAILTLAFTGIRISELFPLRHSDVDLKTQEARISRRAYNGLVDTPKSGRPRTILVPDQAVEAMNAVPRKLGAELIFPTPAGGVMFRSASFGRYFQQIRPKFEAQLSAPRLEDLARYRPESHHGVTLHELRHACASWMLDQGASIEMVANQLGHSSTRVTELYGHPNEKRMRERLRAIVSPRPTTSLSEVRERKDATG